MKVFCIGAVLLACNLAGFAQTEVTCGQPLDVPLRSRAVLMIDSLSSGLEIVGSDQPAMHVSCNARDSEIARDIHIRFSGNQDNGKLTISGGSLKNDNLRIRIEVPRKTSLQIEMPAGEIKVEDIVGDKNIDLYAGRIAISSSRTWDYRKVELSVDIGALKAPVYDAEKGGFFRTFTKDNSDGEYRLHAHLITGEIDLSSTHGEAEEQ